MKLREMAVGGDSRTAKAKKNILASFLLKGIDGVVYLLLVPVTLGYLNPYEYGIWLTLNSIILWINSFDIGLGNGMRNKLAEAMAHDDRELGRIYVSTTFVMLIVLIAGAMALFSALSPLIDWYAILGTSPQQVPRLNSIVYVSVAIFSLNFIFKFVGNVYLALQLPAVNNLMVVAGHCLSLAVIYALTRLTDGSLMYVAVAYTASPLAVYLIAYPITFGKVYRYLAPTPRCFRREHFKSLLNVGLGFFFLQLAGIVLFAFSNIIISHVMGPEKVTPYNIAYRYFSLVPMAMGIIMSPMWSATTEAYEKGDIAWIRRSIAAIRRILYATLGVMLLMVLASKHVYALWVGSDIDISYPLSALVALYVFIIVWSTSHSFFLNGLGKLRLQTINTLTVAALFLPLSYWLSLKLGLVGMVGSMCLVNLSGAILNTLQFHKLLNRTATGIWQK